jgi:hypothetical protein
MSKPIEKQPRPQSTPEQILVPILIPDSPGDGRVKATTALKPENKPKVSTVIPMPSRVITQVDLVEYLILTELLEKKRDEILQALKAGATVEEGMRSAWLEPTITIR